MADERKTVRIRMIQNIAGRTDYSSTGHYIGEELEVRTDVAKAWIEDGIAVPVRQKEAPEEAVARK